jgi:hypothetical protein
MIFIERTGSDASSWRRNVVNNRGAVLNSATDDDGGIH